MNGSEVPNSKSTGSVRVRYSTIINYIAFIYRLVVSVGFTTIVIRTLEVSEYGVFTTFIALTAIFVPVTYLWTMWAYRSYARGKNDPIISTSVWISIIYSFIASIITIFLVFNIPFFSEYIAYIIILAIITVYVQTLYNSLTFLVSATRPYGIGYISLISDTIRFIAAYIFVRIFDMGLRGALLSVTLTYFVQLVSLFVFLKVYHIGLPKPSLDKNAFRRLVKNGYIPLLKMINTQIKSSGERLFTGLVTVSPVFPAYFGVSYVARRLISSSSQAFTRALSARLLRSPSSRDIEDVLRLTFILTILGTGGLIIYSKTVLSIFKPTYINAYPLLSLYSILSFLEILSNLFSVIGTALDKSDLYTEGLGLGKSLLFKNTLSIALGTIMQFTIASVIFIIMLNIGISDIILLLIPFPIVAIIVNTYLVYLFYKRTVGIIEYKIPIRELLSSIIGIIGIMVFSIITGYNNFIVERLSKDLPTIVYIFVISVGIYFSIIYILSPWVRKFIRKGLKQYLPEL